MRKAIYAGLRNVAEALWRVARAIDRRFPEGSFVPKWAPGPLPKQRERTFPQLGFPRQTDSLCPRCVKEVRDQILSGDVDWKVLVGSTVERVGFRKQVTAQGLAGLLDAAIRLVPDLSQAQFVRAWAGLRPGTPDGLPILGLSPITGLFLATGHFRNGILLAPVTARRMADLLTGVEVRGLEPFSIDRFAHLREDLAEAPPSTGVFS